MKPKHLSPALPADHFDYLIPVDDYLIYSETLLEKLPRRRSDATGQDWWEMIERLLA